MEAGMISATGRAFSLLELLVGLAILSIGLVVILQTFAFSGRVVERSFDFIQAISLARDLLQELELKESLHLLKEGSVRDKQAKFEWDYVIQSLETDSGLYQFNLNIAWQDTNKKENLNFTTLLRK
jgi:prepilin-type N-terminal cleavage/methylation domain-containing protein